MLAFDEVGDVQHHLSAFGKAATDFFIQGQKEAVHLKADRTGARLTFTGAGGIFTQVAEIAAAHGFGRELALDFLGATIVDKDFEVHFRFASQLVNIAQELALIGADGLAEALVVAKDSTEAKWEHGGMLKAVGDNPGMIHAGFLVKGFCGVMFAYNDSEVACWVEEDLVAAHSEGRFHRNRFAMTG
jgi:hypothetical protein